MKAIVEAPISELKPHRVVTREAWLAERRQHLEHEKEFTRRRDALSAERRELPWVKVEDDYTFDTGCGKCSLGELFAGRSQLIVYHFMLAPGWGEGCRGCSFVADHFNSFLMHLNARDVTLVAVSSAPLKEIEAFQERMGWLFPWVSSFDNGFNVDYGVAWKADEPGAGKVTYNYKLQEVPMEEMPGLSVFAKNATGDIFHTYSTYSRGLDLLLGAYNFLDLVPKGRDEAHLEMPMQWIRHHDKYGTAAAV